MKKLHHTGLCWDIFHVTFLSYGVIIYCEISMLEETVQIEKTRKHPLLALFFRIYVAYDLSQST